jgi:uncharacterized protein YneF (UPF0154 family)
MILWILVGMAILVLLIILGSWIHGKVNHRNRF